MMHLTLTCLTAFTLTFTLINGAMVHYPATRVTSGPYYPARRGYTYPYTGSAYRLPSSPRGYNTYKNYGLPSGFGATGFPSYGGGLGLFGQTQAMMGGHLSGLNGFGHALGASAPLLGYGAAGAFPTLGGPYNTLALTSRPVYTKAYIPAPLQGRVTAAGLPLVSPLGTATKETVQQGPGFVSQQRASQGPGWLNKQHVLHTPGQSRQSNTLVTAGGGVQHQQSVVNKPVLGAFGNLNMLGKPVLVPVHRG